MKAISCTESAKEVIVDRVLDCRIQFSAGFPNASMPKRGRLRNLVVSAFPKGELIEMASVDPGMLFALLRCVASKKATAAEHDVALPIRIDFQSHSLQATFLQQVIGIEEAHYFPGGSSKASIDGVGLALVVLNMELKNI